MPQVYIGLGSNIEDRVSHVQQAVNLLKDSENIKLLKTSSLYETEPVGYKDQDWFVNAVVIINTMFKPHELLKECQKIEKILGRDRENETIRWGPRSIDLDIFLYDSIIISTDELQIPHPRLHERAYALVPLLEIAPEIMHPILGIPLADIYNKLVDPEEIYLYGTKTK